ncbi:MAG: periplasmic heavy metal sensor [Acidobacteriota bacterium]
MTKRLLIAVMLLVCSAAAQAQQLPPGKWWRRAEVVRELQLSSDQQQRLDEIFNNAANELIDAKAAVEKLQVAIRAELDRGQVRRPELQRIATQLSAARGKLFERELMMLVDMRGILEEEQWDKMRARLDQIRERPALQQRRQQRR